MKTLRDILIKANAFLDMEATDPTGTEEGIRVSFADRAVWDAAAIGQFKEFKKVYETTVTRSSLASISLPSDWREFQETPRIKNGGAWHEYEEIKPEDKYDKDDADKYSYVLGTPEDYTLIINQPLAGDLSMVYQRFPSGLATLTDKCELPDPNYVITKIEAYVLEARGDERFPLMKSEAEKLLLNMAGREMKMPGGGKNRTPVSRNPLA